MITVNIRTLKGGKENIEKSLSKGGIVIRTDGITDEGLKVALILRLLKVVVGAEK